MPRRSRFDPLATSDCPRWLVVKDAHSQLVDARLLPAGTDLHALMAATIAQRQADGWQAEGYGCWGFVFIHRAGVRRMIAIVHVDPAGEQSAGAYASQAVTQPATVGAFLPHREAPC